MNFDIFFRLGVLLCFTLWRVYWKISENKTESENPKKQIAIPLFSERGITKMGVVIPMGITVIQLLGFPILSITTNEFFFQLLGLSLAILGTAICIAARKELASNWAAAYEYQIKKRHELITTGIYRYIRHPIYTGLIFMIAGGQLAALSYFILPLLVFATRSYIQATKEEALLAQHFGKEYKEYMKRSKMFIPFIL
jgi:protein-S-isoprenylcysteine O-methyltransferase Ste14